MKKRTILLKIEYDGTGFSGWQIQKTARTVQGVLQDALTKVLGQPVSLDGVSRTDAGVHAMGQCATFSGEFGIPTERIPYAVNHILAGRGLSPGENMDVRIASAKEVPEEFHARFNSRGKRYRYLIYNGASMPVFLRNYRYLVEKPLDISRMQEAAEKIEGTHDFACFQASGSFPRATTVRTVHSLSVRRRTEADLRGIRADLPHAAEDVLIEVSGDGFLYHMVRNIAGTLVEIGLGRMEPSDIPEILESRDRSRAGHTAPPQGLWLDEVFYDPDDLKMTGNTEDDRE
ncbi:MAG: tRNA pseudouridine(38-40) synthase TruA [Eubacteriales bacterium]|nr:tRNA pseudouridine(38-40) synthase TruA [Eubacteriales bacterium]